MSEEKKDKPNLEGQFQQAFKFLGPQLIAQIVGGTQAAKATQGIMDQMRTQEASEEQRIEQRKLDQAKEERDIEKAKREERSLQVRERGGELREQELDVASEREATRREELTQKKYERAVERFTNNTQVKDFETRNTLLNDIEDIITDAPEIAAGVIGFKIAKGIANEVGNLTNEERKDSQITPSFFRKIKREGTKFLTGKLPKEDVDELKKVVTALRAKSMKHMKERINRVSSANRDYVDEKRFKESMYQRYGIEDIQPKKDELSPEELKELQELEALEKQGKL